MSTDEKTSISERRKHLRVMKPRNDKADRGLKGQLLDEMGLVTGMNRKVLVRLMSR